MADDEDLGEAVKPVVKTDGYLDKILSPVEIRAMVDNDPKPLIDYKQDTSEPIKAVSFINRNQESGVITLKSRLFAQKTSSQEGPLSFETRGKIDWLEYVISKAVPVAKLTNIPGLRPGAHKEITIELAAKSKYDLAIALALEPGNTIDKLIGKLKLPYSAIQSADELIAALAKEHNIVSEAKEPEALIAELAIKFDVGQATTVDSLIDALVEKHGLGKGITDEQLEKAMLKKILDLGKQERIDVERNTHRTLLAVQ